MPFQSRFGLHVVVNGHVLKDLANGEVHVRFGEEYAIRLRNRHKERHAVVKLFIDGEEQSKGGFIIPPNSYRDIRNSSYSTNVFKFVDLEGQEALDAGKDQANEEKQMGVVEARFYLEKEKPKVQHHHHYHSYPDPYPVPVPTPYPWPRPWRHPYRMDLTHYYDSASQLIGGTNLATYGATAGDTNATPIASCDSSVGGTAGIEAMGAAPAMYSCDNIPVAGCAGGQRVNSNVRARAVKDGATVAGSNTGATYGTQWVDIEDDYVPLRLFMRGYHQGNVVAEVPPAGGPADPDNCHCDQCGAKSARKTSKFCHVCGSKLLC